MFTFNITPDCFLTDETRARRRLIVDPRETPVTVEGTVLQWGTTTHDLNALNVFGVAVPPNACGKLVKAWCAGEGREALQEAVLAFLRGEEIYRLVEGIEDSLRGIPTVLEGADVIELAFEDPFNEIGRDLAEAQRRAARGHVEDPVAEAIELELDAIEDWIDQGGDYARLSDRETAADAIRAYIESVEFNAFDISTILEDAGVFEQAFEDPLDWRAVDTIEEIAPDSALALRHLVAFARAQGFKSLGRALVAAGKLDNPALRARVEAAFSEAYEDALSDLDAPSDIRVKARA